jgi:hypothetical protein
MSTILVEQENSTAIGIIALLGAPDVAHVLGISHNAVHKRPEMGNQVSITLSVSNPIGGRSHE